MYKYPQYTKQHYEGFLHIKGNGEDWDTIYGNIAFGTHINGYNNAYKTWGTYYVCDIKNKYPLNLFSKEN